jgi:hypothetical protein
MSDIEPLPDEVSIPEIPLELPDKGDPWTWVKPETWSHPEIPLEIVFPVGQPKKVLIPLKIKIAGKGIYKVAIALTAVEPAQSGS